MDRPSIAVAERNAAQPALEADMTLSVDPADVPSPQLSDWSIEKQCGL